MTVARCGSRSCRCRRVHPRRLPPRRRSPPAPPPPKGSRGPLVERQASSMTSQVALYAGSFDPPTNGHLDLVERAAQLFPRVIVAIGKNSARQPLFSVDERLDLLRAVCAGFPNVTVDQFDGLLIN